MTTDKTSTAPVMSLQGVYDWLMGESKTIMEEDGLFHESEHRRTMAEAIKPYLNAPTPDVVGGDVVARAVKLLSIFKTWIGGHRPDRDEESEEAALWDETESVIAALTAQPKGAANHEFEDAEQVAGWLYMTGMKHAAMVVRNQIDVRNARIAELEASHPAEQTRGDGVAAIPAQSRAALLWLLWHHQGGSSPVGQPIRQILGMDTHERMSNEQLAVAKAFSARIAAPRQAVPGGWQLVPVEPTEEIREAIMDARSEGKSSGDLWDDALAAAPSAGRMGVDRG